MTPADHQTVARKLGYLQKALENLLPYRTLKPKEFDSLPEKRYATERLLQTAIESAIDCARLLVALESWRPLRDERDAFLLLAERKVFDDDLAARLLRAKGFRNILVHEYVAVDPKLVAQFLAKDLDDLQAFAVALARWIQARSQ